MGAAKGAEGARDWIEARKRHRLSHAQVQMARELGMNPRQLGKLDNHKQESWKAPLGDLIEDRYWKRFKKDRPDKVVTTEDLLRGGGQTHQRQGSEALGDAGRQGEMEGE